MKMSFNHEFPIHIGDAQVYQRTLISIINLSHKILNLDYSERASSVADDPF